MNEITEFMHAQVNVQTHSDTVYRGTLLGIDQYINIVLQDTYCNNLYTQKPIFIKGSNVLFISLVDEEKLEQMSA